MTGPAVVVHAYSSSTLKTEARISVSLSSQGYIVKDWLKNKAKEKKQNQND